VALVWKLDHIIAFLAVVPDFDEGNNFSEERMMGSDNPDRLKN